MNQETLRFRVIVSSKRRRIPIRFAGLTIVLGLSGLGCSLDGGVVNAEGVRQSKESTVGPGVDPNKAFLALDQIEPVVSTPIPASTIEPLSDRAAAQVTRARSLVQEQRFTEASIALDRALRFDPDHPAIHAALASLHWESGNMERARVHADRAVELKPDLGEAHIIRARIAAARGAHFDAVQSFRMALLCGDVSTSPTRVAQVDFQLAPSLAEAGYLKAAIDSYQRFLSIEASNAAGPPDLSRSNEATARMAMAGLLGQLGRPSDAADALAPILDDELVAPDIPRRHAEFLIAAGRFNEAEAAIKSLPASQELVLDLLEALYRKSGHPERLIEALRDRLHDKPQESRTAVRLSRALTAAGRSAESSEVLRAFLKRVPESHEVRLELIHEQLLPAGEWSAAVDMAAEGLAIGGATEAYEGVSAALVSQSGAVASLLDSSKIAARSSGPRLYLLARLAQSANRSELVESLLQQATERSPEFLPARRMLAETYFDAFRYEDAIRAASLGTDEIPKDLRLALVAGRAYERLDRTHQAELHLRAVTQLDRTHTQAMLELARVYLQSGRSNLAQRQLLVLLEQDPLFDAARELLAVLYMSDGKIDEAFAQVREMQRLTRSPLVKARCRTLLDNDLRRDPEARRAALLSAIEEYGGDFTTWIAVAETFGEFESEGRRDAYQQALLFEPNNEDALLGLVDAQQRLLDYEASVELLELLMRIRPHRDAWRLALLDAYSVLGRDEEVLDLTSRMDASQELDVPRLRDYRSRRIKALRRLDRSDDLLAVLEGWARAEPANTLWSLWLADECLERGAFDRAIAIYQNQIDERPQDWGAVASLADALVKGKHADRAAQLVLGRLGEDPDSDQGAWMLAGVLSDSGETQAAVEFIRDQLRRTQNREAFQDLLIDRFRGAHRMTEAIEFIDSLLDELVSLMHQRGRGQRAVSGKLSDEEVVLSPNEPFTPETVLRRLGALRIQKGMVLLADGQYREGEELLIEWLESAQDPGERGRLLWLLAACQRGRGDEDSANETLRRALLLQPDNVSLNNDVSYSLIDKGTEIEDAERMIRHALWRAPEQPAYLDTYGWLLYKKGAFAEAEKWTLRALHNLRRPDAVILDHLGDIVWRLGRKNEAIEYWRRADERVQMIDFAELRSADERRVRDETKGKIEAAESDAAPGVAPLATPSDHGSDAQGRTDATKL